MRYTESILSLKLKDTTFELHNIGEVRMATDAWDLRIKTSVENFDLSLRASRLEPFLLDTGAPFQIDQIVTLSRDEKFAIIKGTFYTLIFNFNERSLSLFKFLIRDRGIWCSETPVWGEIQTHVSGNDQHYYVQFPFFSFENFVPYVKKYHELRLQQIMALKKLS
ncbi:MAG: hypothetical protein ACLGG0_08075 [Bacteriovoracia bacterium]